MQANLQLKPKGFQTVKQVAKSKHIAAFVTRPGGSSKSKKKDSLEYAFGSLLFLLCYREVRADVVNIDLSKSLLDPFFVLLLCTAGRLTLAHQREEICFSKGRMSGLTTLNQQNCTELEHGSHLPVWERTKCASSLSSQLSMAFPFPNLSSMYSWPPLLQLPHPHPPSGLLFPPTTLPFLLLLSVPGSCRPIIEQGGQVPWAWSPGVEGRCPSF